jgi:hypothetical protein
MIRHIVMWKLKEQAEGAGRAANARKMKALLDACADIVPGILKLEVGVAQAGLECTYDVVMYSEFVSAAALRLPAASATSGSQAVLQCGARRPPMHGLRNLSSGLRPISRSFLGSCSIPAYPVFPA